MTTIEETGLAEALVRLSHLVQHVFAEAGRARDLTPQQVRLLCVLTRGPARMTGLSRSLHLEKSSLTGLVDRIERRGLVERTFDARDRRSCQVALTGAGAELAHAAHRDVTARLEKLIGDLRQADRTRLTSVVTGILAAEES